MGRLLAVLAALTGLLLPALGLSAPTAVLLVPGHALFAALVTAGSLAHGWEGHPEAARRWLLGYLVVTGAAVGALEVGALVRDASVAYWGVPWIALALWGWLPPLAIGAAGLLGTLRERRLSARAVRRRHEALAHVPPEGRS